MSNISNPDDELMTAQQEKDLGHAVKPQPERAKSLEHETVDEKIETDLISNEGLGTAAYLRQRKSETEQALERARQKAREQAPPRRRRGTM